MLVVVVILFALLLYFSTLRPRRSVYGPPSYPILGCLISFYKNQNRLLDWYTELLSQSPSQTILIDRVGSTPTIITANPANVEHILKTQFHNYPKGRPFTDTLGDLLGRGIFNVDGELWHQQRKAVSHEFTTRSLRDLVLRTMETEAERRLLPLLQTACTKKRSIDLQEVLNRFAFDIVCKVSFDMDPQSLLPSMPPCHLARAFDIATAISARRAAEPLQMIWKAKRALRIGSEQMLREAVDSLHKSVMEMVQTKKSLGSEDLLSRLLSIYNKDEDLARDMVINFLLAGRDTISAALTWFFWLLTHHPHVQKTITDEISRLQILSFDTLHELKFLKASLCESMRLYPPIVWDSKHAENDDILPDGTFVPQGSRVTYFPYGMGRMETLWGKDCLEFRPWRWLNPCSGNEEEVPVSTYKFPIFHGGPRQCLGKDMAFMEMKYIVAVILSRFELKPINTNKPQLIPFLTTRMAGGFHVLVKGKKV
ncbi:Cytochrome P450 94B3 [Nymphaea thermarum]|nr:Cytochrome P450 94B3 [Nymphaea thermarum]